MSAKSLQSCPTLQSHGLWLASLLCHEILQVRILEWVAMLSSKGSSQPRDRTHISSSLCIAGRFFTTEPWGKPIIIWSSYYNLTLEKTLESLLDYKEIKSVNPKGNQFWIFIGRIVAKAEIPIFWPLDVKSQLTGKDPDASKDRGQEEKG